MPNEEKTRKSELAALSNCPPNSPKHLAAGGWTHVPHPADTGSCTNEQRLKIRVRSPRQITSLFIHPMFSAVVEEQRQEVRTFFFFYSGH